MSICIGTSKPAKATSRLHCKKTNEGTNLKQLTIQQKFLAGSQLNIEMDIITLINNNLRVEGVKVKWKA